MTVALAAHECNNVMRQARQTNVCDHVSAEWVSVCGVAEDDAHPGQLMSLVAVAAETGKMSHPRPTGCLGDMASARFTACATRGRPITSWGLGLLDGGESSGQCIGCEWGQQRGLQIWYISYKSFSLLGWVGRSGHKAPMIAPDGLQGAGSEWDELMGTAGFHVRSDSDSTAVIACCCWGLCPVASRRP
ncbi:LOW QUALITY PROTEIN: ADP-ribosylhydrolase ARH1-like [Aplochiton taeniatus]